MTYSTSVTLTNFWIQGTYVCKYVPLTPCVCACLHVPPPPFCYTPSTPSNNMVCNFLNLTMNLGLRIYTKIQNFQTHTLLALSGLTDFGDISSSTPSSSLLSLLPDKVDFTSISFSITITSAGSSCSSSKLLGWFSWKQPINTVLLLGL